MTDAQIADDVLGPAGAMLSGSKRAPRGCEDHTIYWNACVFKKKGRKDAVSIWYGDLDITAKELHLQTLCEELGETIYVTCEQPWRFDGFKKAMARHDPKWDREVFTFKPVS